MTGGGFIRYHCIVQLCMVVQRTSCLNSAVTFRLDAERGPHEAASAQPHLEEAVFVRRRLAELDAWPREPADLLRWPSAAGLGEATGALQGATDLRVRVSRGHTFGPDMRVC